MFLIKKCLLSVMLFCLCAVGLLFVAGPSHAGFIDFDIGPNGTLSFNGSAFTGTDIPVSAIVGVGTPSNSGVNFSFGAGTNLDFSATNYFGSGWNFGPGGSITIGIDGVTPKLLNGTFTNLTVTPTAGGFDVIAAGILDQKDPTLAAFYGWGGVTSWVGTLNLSFQTSANLGSIFGTPGTPTALVGTGDVLNTPVPEPATMLLLGSGLIGVAGFARKRFRK